VTGNERDVLDLFEQSATHFEFDNSPARTAPELVDDGRRLATWLGTQGFAPGDRVAIHLHNTVGYLQLLLACAAGGFVAVSVNTRYSESEVAELIERSGARTVEATADEATTDAAMPAWAESEPIERVCRRDDPFVVFTTSGTTSRPKMVLHRQHSIADHATQAAVGVGYRRDDTVMAVMPLCGIFGLSSLLIAVAAGCRVIITDYDLERTAEQIAAGPVTCLNGTDDLFHRLLDHGADLSSIRLAGYARFNTSLDGIVERADAAGATLTGLYGMSEVQAMLTLRDPTGDAIQRTRVGGTFTSEHMEYRIVDGELQLRGPSLFAGYLAEGGEHVDVALTAANHDDGWFLTGDLALAEDERTFEYVARIGDVLRLGGFLVSPADIEAALMEDQLVDAAQVVAIDQPTGARPVGFVVLADGARVGFDPDAAIERCRERLARYKVPVRVLVVDDFPTTDGPNGIKIQKTKLREMAVQALADG